MGYLLSTLNYSTTAALPDNRNYAEGIMCSSFGMNLHPDRPPANIESSIFHFVARWAERIRVALYWRRHRQIFWD